MRSGAEIPPISIANIPHTVPGLHGPVGPRSTKMTQQPVVAEAMQAIISLGRSEASMGNAGSGGKALFFHGYVQHLPR